MDRVGINGLREIGADSAGVGFLRVGRPHQLAVARDRTFTLQDLNDHGARSHELDAVYYTHLTLPTTTYV